jgi:hypothetical protein
MKNIITLLSLVTIVFNVGATEIDRDVKSRIFKHMEFLYSCTAQQVTFTCVNRSESNADVCSDIGVDACSRKIIYSTIGDALIMTSISNSLQQNTAVEVERNARFAQHRASQMSSNASLDAANQASIAASQASMAASQASMAAAQASMAAAQASMAANNAAMHAAPPPM